MILETPFVDDLWIHKRCKRVVIVVGVKYEGGRDVDTRWTIDYRYVPGVGAGIRSLWRRGVTPTQTIVGLVEFNRLFAKKTA